MDELTLILYCSYVCATFRIASHSQNVRFMNFGHDIHLARVPEFKESIRPDSFSPATVDAKNRTRDRTSDHGDFQVRISSLQLRSGACHFCQSVFHIERANFLQSDQRRFMLPQFALSTSTSAIPTSRSSSDMAFDWTIRRIRSSFFSASLSLSRVRSTFAS